MDNIFVIIFVAIVIILLVVVNTNGKQPDTQIIYDTYTVKTGDTLWEISYKYCPENYDRRDWIHRVSVMNDIVNSKIYPGDEIKVMVFKEKEKECR